MYSLPPSRRTSPHAEALRLSHQLIDAQPLRQDSGTQEPHLTSLQSFTTTFRQYFVVRYGGIENRRHPQDLVILTEYPSPPTLEIATGFWTLRELP